MNLRFGIDLGGSKIEIIALAAGGETLLRRRIATPQGDYLGTVMAIVGLVESAEAELGARGSVGVGIPGAESAATGLIKNANSTCLIGQPLRRDLQALLQREVRLANDANCFALSEATDGAAAGCETVFGVILGTGVGGGLVVHGRVLAGANRIAGEWGHNPLPAPTADDLPLPACYCGRRGCIESYLSGPATEAEHAARTGQRDPEQGVSFGHPTGIPSSHPAGIPSSHPTGIPSSHPTGIPSSHNLQNFRLDAARRIFNQVGQPVIVGPVALVLEQAPRALVSACRAGRD